MDTHEQREILEQLARDPSTSARERVGALRLLRQIDESEPRQAEDGEVASMEAFMDRRGSSWPPREGSGGELAPASRPPQPPTEW